MERAHSMPQLMSIDAMYKLNRGENAVWGVDGYEVPRKYQDTNKKTEKDAKKYITRKGHFLDDIAKQTLKVPGPQKYDVTYKWVPEGKDKKAKPKSAPPANRNSYIDQVFFFEKKNKFPGVGAYNVTITLEEQKKQLDEAKKKTIKYGQKACFLSDFEYLSNTNPGPGTYNPRPLLPKLHMNSTKPDFWITKHKSEATQFKSKRQNLPDIGTYKPFPAEYETFGKNLMLIEEKKVNEKKIKYWGSEARFKDLKKSKSKMILIVPEPGRYQMMANWPGKDEAQKKEKVKGNWMNRVTKGFQRSIYN